MLVGAQQFNMCHPVVSCYTRLTNSTEEVVLCLLAQHALAPLIRLMIPVLARELLYCGHSTVLDIRQNWSPSPCINHSSSRPLVSLP